MRTAYAGDDRASDEYFRSAKAEGIEKEGSLFTRRGLAGRTEAVTLSFLDVPHL